MELSGVTALVTGGADGIGAGIAERLAAEGMHVVIADLDDRQGPVLAERIGGSFVRTDLADRAGVHAAVAATCQPHSRSGRIVMARRQTNQPARPTMA